MRAIQFHCIFVVQVIELLKENKNSVGFQIFGYLWKSVGGEGSPSETKDRGIEMLHSV